MTKAPRDAKPASARPANRGPHTKRWVALIGASCVTVALVGAVLVYGAVASRTGIAGLDRPLLDWMIGFRSPGLNAMVNDFTELGRVVPMAVVALAGCGLLYWRFRRIEIWVLMSIAIFGALAIRFIGKPMFGRLRPPMSDAVPPYETSFSLPSGHTLSVTVVGGMLAYLVVWLSPKLWARISAVLLAILWAVTMATSRLYLGHHWLTDVVFAWLIGLAWLALLITAHQLWLRFPFARWGR